jgi:hypothetical protein
MKNKFIHAFMVAFLCVTSAFAQEITLITPESATPGQTLDVLIRGINTHFLNGQSIANFGQGITVQKLVVNNSLTATATLNINAGAPVGMRAVTVSTGQEVAQAANVFEVFTSNGDFRVNIEVLPLDAISLSDIDLTKPASAPIMFFGNIYNDNVERNNVKITLELTAGTRGLVGKLSMPITTLAPDAYLRVTNRNFTDVTIVGRQGHDFLNQVKALGTFPPDNYTYKLVVTEKNKVIGSDQNESAVTNPIANPELIAPGNAFNLPLETSFTPFPLFQWFGQMDRYDFALYEVRQGQTPEEAVRNLPVYRRADISANNMLYPASAEKLVSGKVYAWQVRGRFTSSSGSQSLPSEVFRFTYTGTDGGPSAISDVASIRITPDEDVEVVAGESFQFHAMFMDGENRTLNNITPQWQLSSNKGTISTNGLFRAGNTPGVVAVVVKAGVVTEFATVTIKPKPIVPTNMTDSEWAMDALLRQLFGLP